jgi:prolyl-tRNA synthetase
LNASQYFFPTLREVPAEAELVSHQLLLRAGFLRKLSAGVYSYLPLAWRSLRKIEEIIRQEMDAVACLEMRMPTLHPREVLEESGRWDVPVVYHLKDRRDGEFALGFTHEEVITDIARRDVRSWRQLPLLVYQMQTKFRDEPRPRAGVIRAREFTMYDAYSFDTDEAALDVSYRKLRGAYENIFRRCGADFLVVEADAGDIGGTGSQEFMVLSENGEDAVLHCPACGYAANAERCPVVPRLDAPPAANGDGDKPLEIVSTPGMRSVDEVAGLLGTTPENLVKTLIFVADGVPVAVLVRGDREINEVKLARYLGAKDLALADAATVERLTGAPVGFAGPSGLNGPRLVADREVEGMRNFITGANQADAHFVHVNVGRDFTPDEYADVRTAVAGDRCPGCQEAALEEARGIEVGHIFKLGTKYSAAMGATYTAEDGSVRPFEMGSYGIGVTRTLAAIIEQSHDEDGIIWPPDVAPFPVVIVVANVRDEAAGRAAKALHDALEARGIDVLLDDRDERAGVKFKDADLVGYPVRVVAGKGIANGLFEVRLRRDPSSAEEVRVEDAPARVTALLESLRRPAAEQASNTAAA